MKKMTYVEALSLAIQNLEDMESIYDGANTIEPDEVIERLTALRETVSKRGERSDEAKEKASAKRKEQAAAKRAELCAKVLPILREVITTDMTAKEIFTAVKERLPQDFTANKVQYILLNDMKDEIVKTEAKGKANTYRLVKKEGA